MKSQHTVEQVVERLNTYIGSYAPAHADEMKGWVGFIGRGIEEICCDWAFYQNGQLWFGIDGRHCYKLRFNRELGRGGGIQIVRILGKSNGPVVWEIASLAAAEEFYLFTAHSRHSGRSDIAEFTVAGSDRASVPSMPLN